MEKGFSSDVTEGTDEKVSKFLDQIEISDLKEAKAGQTVRFMHDAQEKMAYSIG